MQPAYYTLPLTLDKLMRQHEHTRCTLKQSVIQNLHLLLTTAFGEYPVVEGYGCSIWDNDFDNITIASKIKENIKQSIIQSVQEHEKRLGKVSVKLLIHQEEVPELKGRRIKKRIEISITGILLLTNEPFSHDYSFFAGPYSY
jgi:phage baseplate assembly protein W